MKDKCKDSSKYFKLNEMKNFKHTDEVCLRNKCVRIDYILEVNCYVDIIETKVIDICSEYYLIVKGVKIVNIFYEASDFYTCGKVLCEKFIIPFFEKIKIDCGSKIENISGIVSYCDFDTYGTETVFVNTVIKICIEGYIKCEEPSICYEEKNDLCEEAWYLNNDSIK